MPDSPPHVTALDNLLLRMNGQGDFPALSDSVARIVEVTSSDRANVGALAEVVLRDVTLTQKLLRLVNSVHYAPSGRGNITTVSRAIAMVGFDAIRNMALSLVLLEHMEDPKHAGAVKEEFLRSMLAGLLAGEFTAVAADAEEAFIGGLFQNLGRMLAVFYFPTEAAEVRKLLAYGSLPSGEPAAALKVLGVNYEDFGVAVARLWGLPDALLRCMRKPVAAPPARLPDDAAERLRWTVFAANEIADLMQRHDPAAQAAPLQQAAVRFARTLGLTSAAVQSAVGKAQIRLQGLAEALRLEPVKGSVAARLLPASSGKTTG